MAIENNERIVIAGEVVEEGSKRHLKKSLTRRQVTASKGRHIVIDISGSCIYECTGIHLGNFG